MAECADLHAVMLIDIIAFVMLVGLLAVLYRITRHHHFHGRGFFVASLIGAIIWLSAITLEHRAITEACKIMWAQGAWLGIGLLPMALFFFIDDYARARDTWDRTGRLLVLTLGPVAFLGMAGTNAWHGLFYGPETGLVGDGPGAQVRFQHGPLFAVAAIWLYGFVSAGVLVLLRGLRRGDPAHRSFFLTWLLLLVLPIATNLAYVLGDAKLMGLDPTAYAYALSMMALSWFVLTDRLMDLRAVALEVMWRNTPSPLLIVLPDGHVAAANPAAIVLGKRAPAQRALAASRLSEWGALGQYSPALLSRRPNNPPLMLALDNRRFDVRILPIQKPLNRREEIGRIIWLADVTQRQELEERLSSERDFLQLLMQTSMAGIVALDDCGRVVFANAEIAKLSGQPERALPGMDATRLFPPVRGATSFAQAIGTPVPQRDVAVRMRRADGAVRTLSVNIAQINRPAMHARVVCAIADITEQLETARSLEAARDRAEAANRTKSQFLANMSHEIRTPLNGVLGMAELLEDQVEDPKARHMARTIRESGATLLSVLNDVLDMSKIEAGKMQIDVAPFDPADIAARIGALHEATAEDKGLGWHVHGPKPGAGAREGDLHRIMQVLHNLVSNAIKFTETGRVEVRVHSDPGTPLRLQVRDTGIGMTPEQKSRIFTEFEQGDGSVARRFGGTGLGMAITRKLIEQMHGDIHVETTIGEGTCVTVNLPLPECAAPDMAAQLPQPAADTARDRPLSGLRLIAADDNGVNRMLLQIMLTRAGANVQMHDGGMPLLDAWTPDEFDLVLLDISMPDLDGMATLRALQDKAGRLGASPPCAIAITANVMTHQIKDYRAAGFAGHAGKPFQAVQLVAEIQRVLEAR